MLENSWGVGLERKKKEKNKPVWLTVQGLGFTLGSYVVRLNVERYCWQSFEIWQIAQGK